MTAIKPPGGPGGVSPTTAPDSAKGPSRPEGPSFQERVGEQRAAGAERTGPAQTSQEVIADLRAGKISPNHAVDRLTDLAVQRSGAPPAMRPAIEAQLRDLLSRDPLLQDLLRQMGAAVASDK